ncbi:MAG: pyridoxamine 5'-phosphate oxidase family protein [Termitinemataceae bacterium]|nr:MAG: pyridoxamine 5'-phosphate oxidase family protein [Termitinemataceae bacterium]
MLEQNPNGVFANNNGEQIRTQIISFQFVEGNKVYFGTGSEKPLYQQLIRFPYVSYCTYPDDFEPVLSLNGQVVFTDDKALMERAFNGDGYASRFLRNHYKTLDNPNLKLFYIDVEEIEIYDSDGAKIYKAK